MFQSLRKKLSVKLAAAFFVITIVTIVSGGAILLQLNALIESSSVSHKTRELMTAVSMMKESMLNSETGLRGFLLLRDERELGPYTRGQDRYRDAFNTARQLMGNDSVQQLRLNEADKAAGDWVNNFAEPIIAQLKKDDSRTIEEELAQRGTGKDMFDRFREVLRVLEVEARQQLKEAENRVIATSGTAEIVAYTSIIIAAIAAILLSVFANRTITAPVVLMTVAMEHLSRKEYEAEILGANRADEIGKMAQALVLFRDSLQKADAMAAEREAGRNAENARRAQLEALTRNFLSGVDQIVHGLGVASDQVRDNAQALAGTAHHTNSQASAVAAATNQAACNVETVAAAAEELAASIREVARRTETASAVVRKAVGEAEETNSVIKGLAASADRIGEIVVLIQNIAGQTNLLALNATIEAARAGDAGKGFAVVASEVKSLANQTARATDDIQAQIATVQEETRRAVTAIDRIGSTIRSIDDISASVAAAIEEQGTATQEIARNVNEAAKGTAQVNSTIVNVSEAATETGHAAQEMLTASNGLAQQAQALKSHVDQYVSQAGAA